MEDNRQKVKLALLLALGYILLLIGIPLPIPGFTFLKFSLAAVAFYIIFSEYSPVIAFSSLIGVAFLNFLTVGGVFAINQIAFVLAFLIFYYLYRFSAALAVISVSISMTIFNYFVISPLYIFLGNTEVNSFTYLDLVSSGEYLKTIILVYPAFNLINWSMNSLVVEGLKKTNVIKIKEKNNE